MLRALVNCAKAVLSALYVTIKKPGESWRRSKTLRGWGQAKFAENLRDSPLIKMYQIRPLLA